MVAKSTNPNPFPPDPGNRFLSAPLPNPTTNKKTRDLPDLSLCHRCGLRFPSDNRNRPIRLLKSQWRIVLLCLKCLSAVRSASACSYCFSDLSGEPSSDLRCRCCSRRVHHRCLSMHRGHVSLNPESFTCIDCCAVPKFGNPRVSLEDLVRDANYVAERKLEAFAKAKENAMRKAIAAKTAAERARNALDAVLKDPVPDEELALQLHRAMNGSPRIPRSVKLDAGDEKGGVIMVKCGGGGGEVCALSQEMRWVTVTPDRFSKKYGRRSRRLEEVKREDEGAL